MAEIDNLKVKITADASGVKKGTDAAQKQLSGFAGVATSSFGKISTKAVAVGNLIAKAFSRAFAAISASMGDAVKRVDTLNNFPTVMKNLGIGAGVSTKSINYLQEKLMGLPTTLDSAVASVKRFTAANGNLEASTKMFEAVNNAILAGTNDTQAQAAALEQLTQAYTKGKPEMQDWKTLLQTIPGQLNQVAMAMGYADSSALYNAFQRGEVSMNDFMKATVKLNNEGVAGFASFAEQAKSSVNGIQTSIANLKTAITRGMANIIDAIGQTNIASFFNGVAKAVGTAANYVAAFVRVVLIAINAVRALFGQSSLSFGKTADSANTTASAVGGIGDAASNATDDINGATGAAKKLAKQLAGFDEMNVLKEPESGSGGGGGGAGGAGVGDLSGFDFGALDLGEITDPIQEAYDKIMGLFNGLDLSKWYRALGNFTKGAKNYAKIMVSEWTAAWDQLFKPLAKYVAENTLPDFLNGIGEALQRLNPETWGRGFVNFFGGIETTIEGFLDIITSVSNAISGFLAVFSNIVIPPALTALGLIFEQIGVFLKGIGEGIQFMWEEELQPALDKLNELMAPIIEDIQRVAEGLSQNTALMEALKNTGQVFGIVVGAAINAVAEALAFVGVTIGIVIDFFLNMVDVAVTGIEKVGEFLGWLIAEIQLGFENAGKFVKNIWNGIKDFFGGLATTVGNIFTGIWNTIKSGAQNAWNGIKSVFSTVASFFQSIFTNAWTAVKNVFSTGGQIFTGIKDGIVNAFKTIVNAIIGGINRVVSVPFNAINGMLDTVRNINILGVTPFSWIGSIGVPQIPQLAKGGVIDGATIAMVGEAGREAVVPLENNTGWIDQLARDIEEKQSDGEPIHITINVGEDTLLDKIIDGVNEASFMSNRAVINI